MKVIRWFLKWGLISLLSLVTLIFVLISGGANPIINSQIKRIERVISQDAQRPVKLSRVDLRAFPSIVLEVDQLTLGEREGSAWVAQREALGEPLEFIELKQVAFRFKVWQAIISLGQDLELEAMNVEGLHITLHRNREGNWNFEDAPQTDEPQVTTLEAVDVEEPDAHSDAHSDALVEAQAPHAPSAPKSAEERRQEREELKRVLSSLKLSGVGIKDLKVRLIDEFGLEVGAVPRAITLAKLDLAFPRLEVMDMIEGSLSASLFEDRENLTMSFQLGPLSALFDEAALKKADELGVSPFPIEVSLKADALSFKALTPYVPAGALAQLDAVQINGGVSLKVDPKGEVKSSGGLSMTGLKVKESPQAPWGPELNLTLEPNLLVSLPQDLVDLDGLSVKLNEMALNLNGQVTQLSSDVPQLKGLSVKTEAVRLERLLSLVPPVRSQLPPGSTLSGPLSLSVVTSGDQDAQQVSVLLDLTSTDLQVPDQLLKPAGVPVRLALKAGISPARVQLNTLDAQLSDLVLSLTGVIQPAGDVSLKGGVSPFSINKLVRLIPSVQASLPPELTVEGVASLELDLQQRAKQLQLTLKAGLESCQLDTPEVKLIGSGRAEVKVQGDPSATMNISALSDLKGLTIKAGSAFDKPAGVPLDLQLKAEQGPSSLKISQLEAHLASLDLVGTGRQTSSGFELSATLKPSPLGPLIALAPDAASGVPAGIKQGRLGFDLKVKAGQGADELSCVLDHFSLITPKSDLKGQLNFKRPTQPVVSFDLSSTRLDLDELTPPTSSDNASSSAPTPPTQSQATEPPQLTLNGAIFIKKGQANGVNFKDLKAQIAMQGPKVNVPTLQVDVFKGQVKAAPLQVTLPSDEGSHFKGQLALKNIDIEDALKALSSSSKKSLAGVLDAEMRLEGEGSAWEELSPTLHGEGSISLERGVLYGLDPEAAIINELARKVPGVKKKRPAPLKLKTLQGQVEVKRGAVHLKEPIDVQTSEGPLRLEGALGLNLEADLKSTLSLSPKRLSKQLGKPIPQREPIKVPFQVQGPLSDPKISGVGLAAVVAVAAVALGGGEALKVAEELKGKGKRALQEGKTRAKRALKRGKRRAKEELDQQRKRAEETASEARAKAQAEADKAKREAQKRADEAKKKADGAKQKAKKEAGKAAKKLKGLF